MKQTLTWTALPNGWRGPQHLTLSAFVAPRLYTDGPDAALAAFPDWLDWPATELRFAVVLATGERLPAIRIGPPPRSDLWTALFGPQSYVRGHAFPDLSEKVVLSYPAAAVVEFLAEQYAKHGAASPESYPAVADLLAPDGFGAISFLDDRGRDRRERELLDALRQQLARNRHVPTRTERDAALDLLQLKLFHADAGQDFTPPEPPRLDFHQVLSLLGEHPWLLRELGLVHDLELPAPPRVEALGTIQLEVSWAPILIQPDGPDVYPATRCLVDAQRFLPAPRADDPELVEGMLPLDDERRFAVVQIDPDGAGLKALDFAKNLKRSGLPEHRTDDTPTDAALPSLRTAGFSVVRRARAAALLDYFDHITALNPSIEAPTPDAPLILDAEDLTRGYRIDVWDEVTGRWHSLMSHREEYQFRDAPPAIHVEGEEGMVSLTTTARGHGSPDRLYLPESVFQWTGWSLAAPRPMRTLNEHDQAEAISNSIHPDFPLAVLASATSGTLPSLRFGTRYRFRARAVDLAGNSVRPGDSAASATAETPYLRFEPVQSPTVLLESARTEGESAERAVLRSDFDEDPGRRRYPVRLVQRHVVPAKTSQLLAEQHGMFDSASGLEPATYAMIVAREAGSFEHGGVPDPSGDGQRYYGDAPLTVPYLPDPLARGAAFRFEGLPSLEDGQIVQVPFRAGGDEHDPAPWPEAWPIRLLVFQGSDAPTVDAGAGEWLLQVPLPKAAVVRVQLSHHLERPDLGLLGMWAWISDRARAQQQDVSALSRRAVAGQLWALTPRRELVLVHAVRRPLKRPEFDTLLTTRPLGATSTTLQRLLRFSRKSTARVDVLARWREPVDEGPGGPVPTTGYGDGVEVAATACTIPLDPPTPLDADDEDTQVFSEQHELGDTKHRVIDYRLVATTRFSEHFVERIILELNGDAQVQIHPKGIVPGSDAVRAATRSGGSYQRDVDYTIDPEGGWIARIPRGRDGIPDGGRVEVAFVAPPITRHSKEPVTLDVPSSARPAAPRVRYVLPTFGWSLEQSGATTTSTRTGNGLRVYLDRPWWSSGDGELLGVVLWHPAGFVLQPPDAVRPFATRWGFDPTVDGEAPHLLPRPEHLSGTGRAGTASGLSLEETDVPVTVVGYRVAYDAGRELWFADVDIDIGPAYLPFVRLALTRYQPSSVADAHLSRVALADFIQLAANRTASVTVGRSAIEVAVVGRSHAGTAAAKGPGVMTVQLERRNPSIASDLGWEPLGSKAIQLTPRPGLGGATAWTGEIAKPARFVSGHHRLVVEEHDRFQVNPEAKGIRSAPRLVFTDVIPL